ncbi:MAG: hypothetical protein D8M59_00565 [Planctomycetes bacterium]|nr:hypothetical protein [Planctomycetota bacterium]NOG54788.1 hypothetical protein [Planctomycetota bacterium]
MALLILLAGLVLAVLILSAIPRIPWNALRGAAALFALIVLIASALFSSVRYVGESEVGIVIKNIGAKDLPPGRIIATNGEKGPQAAILGPGWHPWIWPIIFDVEKIPVTSIEEGEIGLVTANDGLPLPEGVTYAEEWPGDLVKSMVNEPEYFLTEGNGYKGPQTTVLTPGKWRINTRLFSIEKAPATNIEPAMVGVIKSNVGSAEDDETVKLVEKGQRGIWRSAYGPSKLYMNTKAYEITMISTQKKIVRYTSAGGTEETEIKVRTSDGFTFPVDVRVEYHIKPESAPLVVAEVRDDGDGLQDVLNSVVRAVFRNNAENVKALDYVQQRSIQESQSLEMIARDMEQIGVTVTGVRIGDVGDEESLGALLKTQTDREIAIQEEMTFKQQQLALEQKKEVSRTEQEAEEERRLATATYEIQIAEAEKERRIIEANAEAEAIQIKADAQAAAYQKIAEQIGKGNAALVELLTIVGESGINITPRVMVTGSGSGSSGTGSTDAQTTALIGTMLDSMVQDVADE